jgi:hypothetical protein
MENKGVNPEQVAVILKLNDESKVMLEKVDELEFNIFNL